MTIQDILDNIDKGSSALEETKNAIERAKASSENNVFLEIYEERALKRAEEVDKKRQAGDNLGRLAGVPFVAKDNFLTHGGATTAASGFLKDFVAPMQATAVNKIEDEDAICIGKVNLDSFAHGGSTENSAFGVTKNAIDETKVAGGSSGGSAVAVALDIVPFALGTDTGGSIRQPASFNGVVGYKPTYGLISRYGVVAMASSTDVVGVLSTSVDDATFVTEIMSGHDTNDMTTLPTYFPTPDSTDGRKRFGLIKELMADGVDESVKSTTMEAVEKLKQAGYQIDEVSLPMSAYALAMYYIIVPAEVSSNMARYDGIRYGNRSDNVENLSDVYEMSREEGFTAENKRRIIIGSYVLSSGYFDAYYQKAQKARTLLIEEFNKLFEQYDGLISPVSPTTAFGIGERSYDPLAMYMSDLMTVGPSMAGLPAISVPVGKADDMPVGLQVIGKMKDDSHIFATAKDIEEIHRG